MTAEARRWFYVIDRGRNRFAIDAKPVVDCRWWQSKVSAAAGNGKRSPSMGSIPIADAPTRTDAVAATRRRAPDAVQYEPRIIFAAGRS